MLYRPSFSAKKSAALAAVMLATAYAPTSAWAQQQKVMAANPPVGAASATTSAVSKGDCLAFGHYLAEEARDFSGKLSATFLRSVIRFAKAGCSASDDNGQIQIVTDTDQDLISFRTALRRMGKVDILSASGVAHCDRPANGICPTRTSGAIAPKSGS